MRAPAQTFVPFYHTAGAARTERCPIRPVGCICGLGCRFYILARIRCRLRLFRCKLCVNLVGSSPS
jgi:hypothetical protein